MGVQWKENAVVNVKLTENLYTVAQLYQSTHVQFFKISNTTGKWDKLNLMNVPKYIFSFPDKHFCQEHFQEILKHVQPIEIAPPQYAVMSSLIKGKCLVETVLKGKHKIYDSYNVKIIRKGLDSVQDENIIRQYEMIGMENSLYLKFRLVYFYETGIDIDISKLSEFYPEEGRKWAGIFNKRFNL